MGPRTCASGRVWFPPGVHGQADHARSRHRSRLVPTQRSQLTVQWKGGVPLVGVVRIEWFFIHRNDDVLRQTAIKQFIEMPWLYGWDPGHNGLLYFLDTGGHCPVQLEWCSKLWWPHCEALIASLMAYRVSNDSSHWALFKQCLDYTMSHVCSYKYCIITL